MKLIMQTVAASTKCKTCDKIDTKQRRRASEVDRINRWRKDGKFVASIAAATLTIEVLDKEIAGLLQDRQRRANMA